MDYKKTYEAWLSSSLLTQEERNELVSIKDNDKEIQERFYKELEFGTAGLRGVMEMGTNRMNRFMIAKATQGLATYLNKTSKNATVAIGYDSRNHSEEYARVTAATLAANGIKAYLYRELSPVPTVSFAVRYLKTTAGVMVTASHNPKQYNGYKVYGSDGCQCTGEFADGVFQEILKLDVFKDIVTMDFEEALRQGKVVYIDNEVEEAYLSSTVNQSIYKEEKKVRINYTPLYGAGRKYVTEVLRRDGFTNVDVIKEQELPNGDFPTCPYPNPEMHAALKLGIEALLESGNDILLATDPDSDRVGVAVNQNGEAVILTGNEVGLILFDAIFHAKKESGELTNRPVLVKTIVSTDMINVMAKAWGVEVREVLTGFKYIGGQIYNLELENATKDYLLGFEESCGYLTNPSVRDKDAVNACLLLAEIANHYKLQGKTLVDRLNELYATYGDYKTKMLSYEFPGIEGVEKIKTLMSLFRSKEVTTLIPGIDHIGDYKSGVITYKDHEEPTGLPSSDVVKFFLEGNATITIRPSGTEPKLKAYVFANGQANLDALVAVIQNIIK